MRIARLMGFHILDVFCRSMSGRPTETQIREIMLPRLQVFQPEGAVGFLEVVALIAVVAVHAVGVDHEVEVLSRLVQGIQELEGVLVVDVVVTGAVSQFQHYRSGGRGSRRSTLRRGNLSSRKS